MATLRKLYGECPRKLGPDGYMMHPSAIDENKVCDHEWEFHDESFDHEFGTEISQWMECNKCGEEMSCEQYKMEYFDESLVD